MDPRRAARSLFLLGLVTVFGAGLVGCGSDDGATEAAGVSTTGPAVACDRITLSSPAAEPLDTVFVSGVPAELGDSLFSTVYAPEDSLGGLAFTRRLSGDRAAVRVPIHPSFAAEGGSVQLTLSNGDVSCPTRRFEIQALPEAPGTMAQVVDTSLVLIREYANLFGVSDRRLREAPLDQMPGTVLPYAIARRLLGDPSDDSSRLHRLRSGAADLELFDRLFAKAGATEVLTAQLQQIRQTEPFVRSDEAPSSVTGDARMPHRSAPRPRSRAASPFRTASLGARPSRSRRSGTAAHPKPAAAPSVSGQCPGNRAPESPPRRVSCTGAQVVISPKTAVSGLDAATLSRLMNLSLRASLGLEQDAVQYLDAAIATADGAATGFEASVGFLPGPQAKRLSAAYAAYFEGYGMYLKFVKLVAKSESKVLPRYLTGMDVRMSPTIYSEDQDEIGEISAIELRAVNEGWKLDRSLMNGLLSQLNIPWSKGVSKFVRTSGASEAAKELQSITIDMIFDEVFGRIAESPVTNDGSSTGMLACVPSETFGPVSIKDESWSSVQTIEGTSVKRVGRLQYRPVDVGRTQYMISSTSGSGRTVFGAQMARTCPTVDVRPIDVVVDPPSKQVQPGEEVILEAEVLNSEHPDEVEWDVLQGDGTILAARQIGSNLHEARVRVPDPRRGSVIARARSTSDRSHLATANEERAGTSRLHGEPVPLAGVCNPETMQRAVNEEYSGTLVTNPEASDPRGVEVPNPVRVRGGGLLADGGVACSHHVGIVSEDAAADLGLRSTAEGTDRPSPRDGETMSAVERLDSLAEAGKTGGEAMRNALSDLNEARTPPDDTPRDVVFQIYSPSALTFQSMGHLDEPRTVAHGGLAGWSRNAAMLVNIHLPGTTPADLKPGGRYAARAFSPSENGTDASGVIPTRTGFYTRWSGRTVPSPGCPSAEGRRERSRELAACRRAVQQSEKMRAKMEAAGRQAEAQMRSAMEGLTEAQKKLAESFIPEVSTPYDRGFREAVDCEAEVGLITFEGETEVVTGSLSGTVTIDEITEDAIRGSFQLTGNGQRKRTSYTLETCRSNGEVKGHREETRTDPGPISLDGEIHAPNHSAGLFRVQFVTVEVDPPPAP